MKAIWIAEVYRMSQDDWHTVEVFADREEAKDFITEEAASYAAAEGFEGKSEVTFVPNEHGTHFTVMTGFNSDFAAYLKSGVIR